MEAWKTTYPTVGTVMEAGFITLDAWNENLPDPQTDVERTVRRRITSQMAKLAMAEVRERAPSVAEKIDNALDKLEEILRPYGVPKRPRP